MAGQIEDLTVRVRVVENKLDVLASSMDRRFEEVSAAFVEQRQYTEFAFSKIEGKMDAGFSNMDARFSRLDRKLDQFMDAHLRSEDEKPHG